MTVRRPPRSRTLQIAGPAGVIETLVEEPGDAEATSIAVVCHPHPLHGGSLQHKVTYTLARSGLQCGAAAVRFNFRGVGESTGEHADGVGEIEDARAVVEWARARWPRRPLYLAGFSFGAAVALGLAQRLSLAGLVTVAPPVERMPAALERPACPWLIVQGDQDDIVAAEEVSRWQASFEPRPELVLMPGVGHFFDGQLTPLRAAVVDFLQRAAAARPPNRD